MLRMRTIAMGVLALQGCSAGTSASVADPSFDNWCSKVLCDWQSVGDIAPAPTWHKDDLAVSFESTGAQISQVVEHTAATCFQFDTIADVDDFAGLTLEVDFDDDRKDVIRQQLVGAHWKSITFSFPTPATYQSVRFAVQKEGTGRAVLAQLRVVSAPGCARSPFTSSEATE